MAEEEPPPGPLDHAVEWLATVLDALGLRGSRLRWKWMQRRKAMGEQGMRSEILLRSARAAHKMCPACRALVDRGSRTCPECGENLDAVRAPGIGRVVSNAFPGFRSVTPLILLVNGALFLLMIVTQVKVGGGSGGLGLMSAFDGEQLVRHGSGWSILTLQFGERWRFVTPIFLHAGILHFFFNSYVLIQLGPLVENEYGQERFWVAYLAAGIAGSAASQIIRPVNTVGASGAIFGLMGLLVVYGWRRGGVAGDNIRRMMLRYVAYIVIFGLIWPGIDHINHAGGFVCGALFGLLVPARNAGEAEHPGWQLAALAGVLVVLWAFYQVAAHGQDFLQWMG